MIAEHYAQALFELTEGASDEKLDAVMASFVATLKRQRRMRLLPSIVRHLERKLARADRHNTIELTVAKRDDAEKFKEEIEKHASALGGVKDKRIAVHTDAHLIGGYVIVGNDVRIDASYRKHLLDLYALLTK